MIETTNTPAIQINIEAHQFYALLSAADAMLFALSRADSLDERQIVRAQSALIAAHDDIAKRLELAKQERLYQ
jgi:hypothetical protein